MIPSNARNENSIIDCRLNAVMNCSHLVNNGYENLNRKHEMKIGDMIIRNANITMDAR